MTKDARLAVARYVASTYLRYNPFFNVFLGTQREASFYSNYIHQIHLIARVMLQYPVRVLIADEIGLGKTVEAIRIFKHLASVHGIRRTLIIVPPTLLDQWVSKDLRNFGIAPFIINRETLQTLQDKLSRENDLAGVFIGSMDTLKLSEKNERNPYFETISKVKWDLVIIDEAHKLSYTNSRATQRYENLGNKICRVNAENCVLLTATPHRGKTDDFVARLALLDKEVAVRPRELGRKLEELGLKTELFKSINDSIFFRRTKEDVNIAEGREVFKPAFQYPVLIPVDNEVIEVSSKILKFATSGLDKYYVDPSDRGIRKLLGKLILKRAMSSEVAALKTFTAIMAKRVTSSGNDFEQVMDELESYLKGEEDLDAEIDDKKIGGKPLLEEFLNNVSKFISPVNSEKMKKEIQEIVTKVKRICDEGKSPKIIALLDIIDGILGDGIGSFEDTRGSRMIVFTEFKDTANFVFDQLRSKLRERVRIIQRDTQERIEQLKREYISGSSSDIINYLDFIPTDDGRIIGLTLLTSESKKHLEVFQELLNDENLATVILVSTDVAAEGLNMQSANIIVNYEVTWSPLRREQRLGRVWRLGQKKSVYVFDFFLATEFERANLENYSIKVFTIAEETGHTQVKYKGLIFYIPSRSGTGNEDEREALRIVSLDEYNEGKILDRVISALKESLGENGIDEARLRKALSALASDIVRLTREVKKELEALSKYRSSPDRMRAEIKQLLGFEDEADALNGISEIALMLSKVRLASMENVGDTLYIGGVRVNRKSIRDLVFAVSKAISLEPNTEVPVRPTILYVGDVKNFDYAFLTTLVIEGNDKRTLYREPVLISVKDNEVRILRGTQLLSTLSDVLGGASPVQLENQVSETMSSKYREVINKDVVVRFVTGIDELVREIAGKRISALDILKTQKPKQSKSPNINAKLTEVPEAVFITMPHVVEPVKTAVLEHHAPRVVSPEKKELVKTLSENLVKAYFEALGYRVYKDSEYGPYDFRVCDDAGNIVYYVEVKGHETAEVVAELSENEKEFGEKNKDKYLVCVVTEVLSAPKIHCFSFPELPTPSEIRYTVVKYVYKIGQSP